MSMTQRPPLIMPGTVFLGVEQFHSERFVGVTGREPRPDTGTIPRPQSTSHPECAISVKSEFDLHSRNILLRHGRVNYFEFIITPFEHI
jgi:hypothetical protein